MNSQSVPIFTVTTTYISFVFLIIFGYVRDFLEIFIFQKGFEHLRTQNGRRPIYTAFESFFIRRLYMRIRDCWNRPITGVPGQMITVLERKSFDNNKTFVLTGKKIQLINLSSYNYLGFGTNDMDILKHDFAVMDMFPVNYPGTTKDIGTNPINRLLERHIAEFLKKEDAIVFPMGFGTNSANIPIISDNNTLILSDELNHTSIIFGSKMSPGLIKPFAHNDMENLEELLRYHISRGQPNTRKPWDKVIVIAEGLYSMEGTVLNLKRLVELRRKYKFYLFIDEAHSIGAMGETGRGVAEYLNVPFDEIDIFMGTFTKSFGAAGGYIAADRKVINFLRNYSDFSLYGEQMPPVVAQHILTTLKIIKSDRGEILRQKLRTNIKTLREGLIERGFVVYGEPESPIIPILIYNPGKMSEFSRMCMARGLAIVVVGYPATPVISNRARLCVSAAHTKEDIEYVLNTIEEVGELLGMNVLKKRRFYFF
ncbi:Serine palmitoyltransferase [Pseudoloma neurophilia]|uniref:serine C-palmitoyltransferase n=1 Tax=Pseudoloma neurophilia TaxID=146866 RepID=A0A0R0LX62_9MICR|nr:Serine palmitoyltransferase [Pseudoloma neurophilia]